MGGTCFKLPQAGPQRRGCKQPDTCERDDVFLMIPPYRPALDLQENVRVLQRLRCASHASVSQSDLPVSTCHPQLTPTLRSGFLSFPEVPGPLVTAGTSPWAPAGCDSVWRMLAFRALVFFSRSGCRGGMSNILTKH